MSEEHTNKPHRARQAGNKARRKKAKDQKKKGVDVQEQKRNPKVCASFCFVRLP
jgi:hypothetical protein